jgi:hypothetical protein
VAGIGGPRRPQAAAGFALDEVGEGRHIEGEALAFAWQAINRYTRAPVYVESKGQVYTIMVQIPGVSYFEPPPADGARTWLTPLPPVCFTYHERDVHYQ